MGSRFTEAKSLKSSAQPRAVASTCCGCVITIENCNHVHIYTCGTPKDYQCPPVETQGDACIPVVAGAKPKQSRKTKLAELAATARVPSAIATSIVHMARRFVLGKAPANEMEVAAFPVLERISRDILSCTVDAVDALPERQRNRLFVDALQLDPNEPISESILVTALASEIKQRAGLEIFGDPQAADEERPGQIRVFPPSGEIPLNQVRICRVNGIRTANFIPHLSVGEYLPSELHQDCSTIIVNGQPQVVCQVRTTNCPGNVIDAAVCARVVEVAAGDSMTLEGVNYFSTDATVTITNRETGQTFTALPTRVWGDLDTPLTEVVNGETVLIKDCRVKDRLTFQVPKDMLPGLCDIQISVPNVTGNPAFGPFLNSDGEFIRVLQPPDARFQIVTERISARKETSPASFGSDEVGLQALSFALFADGTFGDAQDERFKDIRDFEFDSGKGRDITRLVFRHDQQILGMALSIAGFEIDSDRAFNELITSRSDFFVDLIKQQAKFIGAAITAAGGLASLTSLGSIAAWVAGIAIAITLGVDVIVALWAPADPIIRDSFGLSAIDLDRLTNANFPPPPPSSFKTEGPGGISVNVNGGIAPEKLPLQYRETREYVSSSEDSRYEIRYRYNRIA